MGKGKKMYGSRSSSKEELFETRLNRRQYKKWAKGLVRKTKLGIW